MDRQCSSCGGFCKKSGCERENVKIEPEPVAYDLNGATVYIKPPIYTAPQKKEWVGLTDREIAKIYNDCDDWEHYEYERAIEAKLKEKNT